MCMKNQQKVKELLNGVNVGNEVSCTQVLDTWVMAKLKLWDTYNNWIWDMMIGMLSQKELVQ